MSGDEQPNLLSLSHSSQMPQTFSETIDQLEAIILQQVNQVAAEKQLFYHNQDHIRAVQRRSRQIFAVLAPALPPEIDRSRSELLLNLCAVAHDLVQGFEPDVHPHSTRQRKSGENELATIDQLVATIDQINRRLNQQTPNHLAGFTNADIEVIRQAIAATICTYDVQEQAIYQPLLYSGEPLSLVSRILALADLNTLGIDGVAAYNREGSLLFLEENLDIIPLLREGSICQLEATDRDLAENIRLRLLKRCRFQVNFAKSRLVRLPQELQGFPERTISVLIQKTFKHLSPATLQTLQATTPTASNTPLSVLLQFFQLEHYLPPTFYQP